MPNLDAWVATGGKSVPVGHGVRKKVAAVSACLKPTFCTGTRALGSADMHFIPPKEDGYRATASGYGRVVSLCTYGGPLLGWCLGGLVGRAVVSIFRYILNPDAGRCVFDMPIFRQSVSDFDRESQVFETNFWETKAWVLYRKMGV